MGNCGSNNIDYLEMQRICIRKALRFIIHVGLPAENIAIDQRKKSIMKIMSVDLNWFHTMEELKHIGLCRSHSRTTYDNDVLTIHQLSMREKIEISLLTKHDNRVHELIEIPQRYTDSLPNSEMTKLHQFKVILYYVTARETQHVKRFNILTKERRLIVTELNTALGDRNILRKKLQEAENKVSGMHNAIGALNSQLLKEYEATRFAEEAKAVIKIAQAENKTLKEEMRRKDNEMLQLKERVAATEKIVMQLQQQLDISKDEMHQQNQLLESANIIYEQICNEKKQLITENEHLKKEIQLLKENLDQQSKLISAQKNDSGKTQEKIVPEGSDTDDGPSGYPKEIFTEEVDDKYLCTRCRRILKNPIQSFCGHRFCRDCFDRLIRDGGGQAICQRCSEECEDAAENTLEPSKTFPDNAIRRELNSMRSICVFEKCKWSGNFKEYEEHFEKCDWRPRRCDTCGENIPNNQFERHKCRSSTLDGGLECKYQCGKPVTGLDFALHLKQLLPEHFEALFRRMETVTSLVSNNSLAPDRKGTLYNWTATIENLVKSLEDRMQKQLESSAAKETNSNVGKKQISERGTVERERAASGATGGTAPGVAVEGPSASDVIQKLAKLSADMKTCESLLTSLDREVEHDFSIVENLQANEAALKRNLEGLAQTLKSMDRVLSLKNASLADLDKRVSDLEQTSYDGSLLWQLTDFQRKRQEAIAGRTTSIYSPPFYTSKTGYKMCARLYLNGDGMGRGTHVSLFFVIMRGQYDALLKWPFRQKVTLMFLDQSGKDQHVMDAFRPDPNSSSFRRPTTEMNIASGCPLFMSLLQLDNPLHTFVKDDTAFIKIVISREET